MFQLYYYLYNDIEGRCCEHCNGVVLKRDLIIKNPQLQISADTNNNVIPIEYGVIINKITTWSKNSTLIMFEAYNPTDIGTGYWKWWNVKDDKYIGIRFINANDTIYGWIKVNGSETITFKEIGISK